MASNGNSGKKGSISSRKRADVQRVINQINASGSGPKASKLAKLAQCIVLPGESESCVFPSPTPGRAGVARFPLVIEVENTAGEHTNFGIIANPDIKNPLQVSHGSPILETNETMGGRFETRQDGFCDSITADRKCNIHGSRINKKVAVPFSTAAGCTVTWRGTALMGDGEFILSMWVADASLNWTKLASTVDLRIGADFTNAGIVVPAGTTWVSFEAEPGGVWVNGFSLATDVSYSIAPSAGTFSCNPTGSNESVMDVFNPAWDGLMASAEEFRVVAMDCLVTYMGSTLDNAGQIAVCNASQDLEIKDGNFYTTCTSQPFDAYNGRLASEGNTEGGAHWHYVMDDPANLSLHEPASKPKNMMVGYFGIKGLGIGQLIRIDMNVVVNFFSTNPEYTMVYQPAYKGYATLLHLLRTEVPLVSSNDGHLDKLTKKAKAAAIKAVEYGIENPEKIAAALSALLSLVA